MTFKPYWLLALVCHLPVQAAESVLLRTEMEADAEMKWSIDGKSGICPEILHAISARDTHISFNWKNFPVPQKRLVAELEQGQIDIACGLGRTAEREQELAIVPVALYDDTLVAAVRKGDTLTLNELADLKNLGPDDTILLTFGARLVERLGKLGIRQVDDGARTAADNLEKLVRGRGRIFLYHEPGMTWEVRRARLENKVAVLPVVLSVDQHYLMLSRRVPPETVKRIADVLAQMKNDGTLHNIEARWSPGWKGGQAHAHGHAAPE